MRLNSLRARNVGVLRDVEVDFDKIDGVLVAITGANGSGKSSLLECIMGSLDRTCPTRGTLTSLATSRESVVEAVVTNGSRWTLRHMLDSVSGKSEAMVLDAAGAPALTTTKVRDFDAWRAAHLPPSEVLLSSVFAAQGSSGFLDLSATERKRVLLRVLGIERLEAMAEDARERAREAKADYEKAAALLEEETRRGVSVETATEKLASAQHAEQRARQAGFEADGALADARVTVQRLEAEWHAYSRAVQERQRLSARVTELEAKVKDLDSRVANNRKLLSCADAVREAAQLRDKADARIAEVRTEIAKLEASLAGAKRGRAIAEERLARCGGAVKNAERRVEQLRERLAQRGAVERAAEQVPALRAQVEAHEAEIKRFELELTEINTARHGVAERRISSLRAGLQTIWDTNKPSHADGVLREDDATARTASEAPERAKEADRQRATVADSLAVARRALATAEREAARIGEIESAARDLVQAEEDQRKEWDAQAKAEEALGAEKVAETELAKASEAPRAELARLTTEREEHAKGAKLEGQLSQAEGRIAELEPQLAAASKERDAATSELAAMGEQCPAPAQPPLLPPLERAVKDAQAVREVASNARATADADLERARASAERVAEMTRDAAAAAELLADWTRIADELGKDGLQSFEIDACGPELTELVNDLLHDAYGSRWSVSIETARLSADGKKMIEGCEISVLDTAANREGAIESYSGGEKVILSEALSLALTTLACRRAGLVGATIIRDESAAALDASNSVAYVRMLRRAATIVGASKLLLVSHNAEVQDLCDARIEVRDGRAEVM